MSAKVLMYLTAVCPYCQRAEMLLKSRGVEKIENRRCEQRRLGLTPSDTNA